MKRIVFFIVSALALLSSFYFTENDFSLDGVLEVEIVSTKEYLVEENIDVIKNGNQYIYHLSKDDYINYAQIFDDYDGIVFKYDKKTTFAELENKWKITNFYQSNVEEMTIYYGYTSKYSDFRLINGKKINIQIAFTEYGVMLGLPLILTGF